MEEIHAILEAVRQAAGRSVLATIVQVEGSAYRHAGAVALFREDGGIVGCLAAGCLEADLAERAAALCAQGTGPQLHDYDLRADTDLTWGLGAGCNGRITVLLEPVDSLLRERLGMLKTYLDHGIAVLRARFPAGLYVFLTENGGRFGSWGGDLPPELLQLARTGEPFRQDGGMRTVGGRSVYLQRFWPKPRLFLFGGGPDARPLASLAARTGFAVTVVDWRPENLTPDFFPDAALMPGDPADILAKSHLSGRDFAVVMTHNFSQDQTLLERLATGELRYLGVLGPRARTARLLPERELPAWLHAPAGLAIGAEGPAEIAVSIVAEMVAHLRPK